MLGNMWECCPHRTLKDQPVPVWGIKRGRRHRTPEELGEDPIGPIFRSPSVRRRGGMNLWLIAQTTSRCIVPAKRMEPPTMAGLLCMIAGPTLDKLWHIWRNSVCVLRSSLYVS